MGVWESMLAIDAGCERTEQRATAAAGSHRRRSTVEGPWRFPCVGPASSRVGVPENQALETSISVIEGLNGKRLKYSSSFKELGSDLRLGIGNTGLCDIRNSDIPIMRCISVRLMMRMKWKRVKQVTIVLNWKMKLNRIIFEMNI